MFPITSNCCCSPSPFHSCAIIIASLSSLSFHPQSTPQAVACEAGGKWCVIHCCHQDIVSWLGFTIGLCCLDTKGRKTLSCCDQDHRARDGGIPRVMVPTCSILVLLIGWGLWQWWGSIRGHPIVIINSKITT